MSKNNSAVSEANCKKISFQNYIDPKDFPALKISCANNKSLLTEDKVINKNKVTKPCKPLSTLINSSEKPENLSETFPKLIKIKQKKPQKSEVIENEKKQLCIVEDTAVRKCKTVELSLQKVVTENESNNSNSSKKVSLQQKKNPNKKKRSEPIFFNIGEILELNSSLKKKKQPKKLKTKFQRSNKVEIIGGNYLDSSNPKRLRGKHREIKKKKHTDLKLAILKERIIKQKIKEKNISNFCDENCIQIINNIDFKKEIEKYLSNLKIEKSKKFVTNKKTTKNNINSMTKTLEVLNLNNENKPIKCDQEKLIETKAYENFKESVPINASDQCSLSTSCNKTLKFSSKFREYCDNIVTPFLNTAVSELIKNLVNLQDRAFAKDPIKAKVKKRLVSGLREVKKYLTMKKVKMVVIAPNLEKLQMEGSINDIIKELKILCNSQNVPCVFALDRYKLGRCTKKNVPVSALAVLNYEGLEDRFQNVLKNLENAKKEFKGQMNNKNATDTEDVNTPVMASLLSIFKEKYNLTKVN